MLAGQRDIYLQQGATWSIELTWQDATGAPRDLTDCLARMQIRKDYAAATVVSLTSTPAAGITLGGVAGTILLRIEAAETAAITASQSRAGSTYRYDLEVEESDGTVHRLLEGRAYVSPEVTR